MKLLRFSVSRASWLTYVALTKNNRENILIHYRRAQSSFEPTPSLCKKPVLTVLPKAHNYSLDTEVKTFLSKLVLYFAEKMYNSKMFSSPGIKYPLLSMLSQTGLCSIIWLGLGTKDLWLEIMKDFDLG